MEKVTIKTYAVTHKFSIFNVMKMVKSSKLKSEVIKENGRDITYIILDEEIEKEIRKSIVPMQEQEDASLKEIVKALQIEVKILREELEVLKKKI